MIPEEDLPSPEEEGQTEDGSRQNWDGRQAEMEERARGIELDEESRIEIALEATTPSQKGSEKSEEKPQMAPHEISDDESENDSRETPSK